MRVGDYTTVYKQLARAKDVWEVIAVDLCEPIDWIPEHVWRYNKPSLDILHESPLLDTLQVSSCKAWSGLGWSASVFLFPMGTDNGDV